MYVYLLVYRFSHEQLCLVVEGTLEKGAFLETICSYCQNSIRLDARTFETRI
jgi:hypothetical protein